MGIAPIAWWWISWHGKFPTNGWFFNLGTPMTKRKPPDYHQIIINHDRSFINGSYFPKAMLNQRVRITIYGCSIINNCCSHHRSCKTTPCCCWSTSISDRIWDHPRDDWNQSIPSSLENGCREVLYIWHLLLSIHMDMYTSSDTSTDISEYDMWMYVYIHIYI